jgi:hypothetical protein
MDVSEAAHRSMIARRPLPRAPGSLAARLRGEGGIDNIEINVSSMFQVPIRSSQEDGG